MSTNTSTTKKLKGNKKWVYWMQFDDEDLSYHTFMIGFFPPTLQQLRNHIQSQVDFIHETYHHDVDFDLGLWASDHLNALQFINVHQTDIRSMLLTAIGMVMVSQKGITIRREPFTEVD